MKSSSPFCCRKRGRRRKCEMLQQNSQFAHLILHTRNNSKRKYNVNLILKLSTVITVCQMSLLKYILAWYYSMTANAMNELYFPSQWAHLSAMRNESVLYSWKWPMHRLANVNNFFNVNSFLTYFLTAVCDLSCYFYHNDWYFWGDI